MLAVVLAGLSPIPVNTVLFSISGPILLEGLKKGKSSKTTMEPDGVKEKAETSLWGFREGDKGTGQVLEMGWPRLTLNQEADVKQDQMAERSEEQLHE